MYYGSTLLYSAHTLKWLVGEREREREEGASQTQKGSGGFNGVFHFYLSTVFISWVFAGLGDSFGLNFGEVCYCV